MRPPFWRPLTRNFAAALSLQESGARRVAGAVPRRSSSYSLAPSILRSIASAIAR